MATVGWYTYLSETKVTKDAVSCSWIVQEVRRFDITMDDLACMRAVQRCEKTAKVTL